ncbi:BLOC-3 complex member HPS4 [Hyla sarda]|uniref:BLOC-3 complex member HPS4 n=1 Tax=Hyla sarda TaxID=327740 RepID=UPI0024C23065|nr:BLOC-3 complex member HPS4 [Hyla sarda]XP_056385179.1 BLOC-3 complex member HPS4 [Hyla sarda]XP_056385189.1 BLOC-3 complex member HPS4 [Hyla sarda]
MASPFVSESRPVSWMNYFFLYDGSKVRGEADPTRDGINYFYPPQTVIDQQELLCGQIAGVVRCLTEIANSPPSLIRLRKQKFAIQVHGEYLWVLGCSVDVSDVTCKCFLEDLIGLFRFYNGPLWHAYRVRSQVELSEEWNLYLEHVQNTSDLHKIFNSLSHVDKTKVDPLLLLKAALILQTCQRFPYILAGCIIYKNRVVSTQLPSSLTSRVLLQSFEQKSPTGTFQRQDGLLPQDVYMIPVFVMEKEATALRQYPVQWMTRMPSSSRRSSSISHSLSEEAQINQSHASHGESFDKEKRNAGPASLLKANVSPLSEENVRAKNDSTASDFMFLGTTTHTPVQSSSPFKPINLLHTGIEDYKDDAKEISSSEDVFIDTSPKNPSLMATGDQRKHLVSQRAAESEHLSTGSFVTCHSSVELEKSSPGECVSSTLEDSQVTVNKDDSLTVEENSRDLLGDETAEDRLMILDITESDSQISLKDSESKVITSSYDSTDTGSQFTKSCNITDWTLTLNANPQNSSSKLVQMVLYVHNVKGLVLALIAESDFKYIKETVQDVHDSTLASLNGLEVHLRETLPVDNNNLSKSTYNFTHYDSIQNTLTANLPSASSTSDCQFLRAANLIHSDFSIYPSLQEVTVRNASSSVYGCQSAVHETYFQQLGPLFRNSGAPDPQDTVFMLHSKAKQKLLKHGLNLL